MTASVVVHELWHRVLRLPLSRRRRELEAFLLETVAAIPVLAYDDRAARWHAAERARLAREGRTPAFVDGQIAAVAAVNGATVVTANVGDFDVFGGLTVETWFERRP